jgi:hypothetical protein
MVTGQEDSPEKTLPVMAYEGYNFLPTSYGYRSYFDTTPKVNINSLTVGGCDYVIVFQKSDYSVIFVALCSDGIYTVNPTVASSSWTKQVAMTALTPGTYKQWSFCIIENNLYIYRQAETTVSKLSAAGAFTTITPSFLNMSGQMGIFRANGRLGFWDSANSVSWSSNLDFSDFTPAIETLAGNAIFNDVLGRIVSIRAFGNGFVIYSTKNITGVSYNTSGSMLFSADTIAENAGIWDSKQVCTGVSDEEHYVYSNSGIKHITKGFQIKEVFTALYDYLKQSRDPVALDFVNGRFLFLNVIDTRFIIGAVNFNTQLLTSLSVRFLLSGGDPVALPTLVEGEPLLDYIEDQVLLGTDFGMVAEWTVDGSKMVPGRDSSISEFQVDDPTTPADDFPYVNNTTPYYTDAELIAARNSATLANVVSINDSALNNLQLGWFKIPYGGTGTVTQELIRFKNRQEQEWEEHRDLVTALQTQISLVPTDYVDSWHSGTYYATNSDYIAAKPADVLDTRVTATSIPWTFSTPVTTITGAGTNYPTFEHKATFTQSLKVYQRKDTTYAGKGNLFSVLLGYMGTETIVTATPSGNPYLPVWTGASGTSSRTGGDSYYKTSQISGLPGTINGISATQDAALGYAEIPTGWPATSSSQITTLKSNLLAYTIPAPPATITYTHSTIPGSQVWTYQYTQAVEDLSSNGNVTINYTHVYKCISDFSYVENYTRQSLIDTEKTIFRTNIYITYDLFGYSAIRIQKTIATSLRTTTEAISQISKGTGTETNLDWGSYIVGDPPPPRFVYSTNQSTVNFNGWASPPNSVLPQNASLTFPGATFLLQNGAISPVYPTYVGAYVYDTIYQKWGKAKADYKCLVDYAPLNSNHQKIVSFSDFGMNAGTLLSTGYITLFSTVCTDSYIKYGRLGYYRQGYTYPEVVTCQFARPFTGEIEVEASLDGRSVHASLTENKSYSSVGYANMYPAYAGTWFNISVTGEFDLRGLEFTGRISGRR